MIEAAMHGRLGSNPVERQTKSGKSMVTVSAAVSVGRPGETEVTEWIGLIAFGKAAELLARQRKSDIVAAMGTLTKSTYTARDGTERTNWSLTVESLISARTVRPGSRQPPSGRPIADTRGRHLPARSAHDPAAPLPQDRLDDLYARGLPS
jgi:single-strand DNA-binding protein